MLALASNPTYQPSVFVEPRPGEARAAREPEGRGRATTTPGSTGRSTASTRPARSSSRSPRSRRWRRASSRRPSRSSARRASRFYQQVFTNWDPYVNQPMELDPGARRVVRHLLLPGRRALLQAAADRGPTLQDWASRFGFGAADRDRHRPRERRARADARLALHATTAARPAATIDRIWKPGYSVQLAIGQGDLEVTPIQMARFYAMIANGGKLVTPHIAEDVETAERRRRRRRRSSATSRPSSRPRRGVDPAYLAGGAGGALRRARTRSRHLLRRLRPVPGPDRRQDRHRPEGRRRSPATRTRSS